jgi:hypothetical protein
MENRTQHHRARTAVTPGLNRILKRPGAAVCLAFSKIFQRVVTFQINIFIMIIITKSCQEIALASPSLDLTFDRQW